MTNYDKVKILVVGDSGVGKTTAVHLMTKNEPLTSPSWTVGVSLEVKLHEYKGGTPQQKTYFVDLWDIGGSSGHRNTRSVFYNGVNGIVLVHDLSNRKSEANLHKWLLEIFNRGDGSTGMGGGGGGSSGGHGGSSDEHSLVDDFDPEQFMGSSHPPILVIGTKLDSYSGTEGDSSGGGLPTRIPSPRPSSIAQECGAEEIFLNCLDAKSLSPGSTAAVKLTRFFDKVIERRYHRDHSFNSSFYDRKKVYSPQNSSRTLYDEQHHFS